MEKGPEFRIVGDASLEKKDEAKESIKQALFEHNEQMSPEQREQIGKFERPKSEKELMIIDFVNEETSRLMREIGINPYNIPVENYHIVSSELYKKAQGGDSSAATTFFYNRE